MNRLIIAAVALAAIVGGIVLVQRHLTSDTAQAAKHERDEAGWRACGACGHVWHMTVAKINAQAGKDPTGEGWVQCPECGAWKGFPTRHCLGCGKRIALYRQRDDGSYARISYCPDCQRKRDEAEQAGDE